MLQHSLVTGAERSKSKYVYIDSIVSQFVLQQAQIYQKYSTRRFEHSGVNVQFISVVFWRTIEKSERQGFF